ncbi:DUF1289 domain-containing protein [Roseibium aggregatum]|uniref:DUF1289 domain-containing protein n=1 Tax=Roseibium aggregatum TaxID=187304 RepID=UPI002E27FC83|nr:DUF1289 domain-containing protein [Roseibium aggregatum]
MNICQIEQTSGLCTGCLRTLDEIAGWSGFSDAKRNEVLADLNRRRAETRTKENRV